MSDLSLASIEQLPVDVAAVRYIIDALVAAHLRQVVISSVLIAAVIRNKYSCTYVMQEP